MAKSASTPVKLSVAEIAALTPAQRRELLGTPAPSAAPVAPLATRILAWAGEKSAKVVNAVDGAPSAFSLAYRMNREAS